MSIPKRLGVEVIKMFKDNYCFALKIPAGTGNDHGNYLLIDPADSTHPRIETLIRKTTEIWTTHHHLDHCAANKKLKSVNPKIVVYGADSRIVGLDHFLKDGQVRSLGGDLTMTTIHTPGHTMGAACFYVSTRHLLEDEQQLLFTGDTLFVGGCGRLFEGSAQDLYHSLTRLSRQLPKSTLIYCGHEYTQSNLEFAHALFPNNKKIKTKLDWCGSVECTLPSSIESEMETNPFLMVDDVDIQKRFHAIDAIDLLAKFRDLKNSF